MESFSNDLEILERIFSYDCIDEKGFYELQAIFEKANNKELTENEKADLNRELHSILDHEMVRQCISFGYGFVDVSPSGYNYLIGYSSECILVNIYGVMKLLSGALFFDGESVIKDIKWIENDNLLLFDHGYIVHGEKYKYICHYSNDDNRFVFRSAKEEYDPFGHISDLFIDWE